MSVERQHLPADDAVRVVARDQQVFLDRLLAVDGALGLAGQHAEDAVGVAHRRDLGVGDDQRLVGVVHRHQRAGLDAGGRIADDVLEAHLARARPARARRRPASARPCRASARRPARTGSRICLSLISAWFSLASSWMTLIRSYTTRRSQPMIRSRLRRPTSKSITAVLWPRSARPVAEAGAGGRLAHPSLAGGHDDDLGHRLQILSRFRSVHRPFGAVFTVSALRRRAFRRRGAPAPACPAPRRARRSRWCDRSPRWTTSCGSMQVLKMRAAGVAARAGDGTAAQRRVDVDAAVGDDFGAVAHHRQHDQVAAAWHRPAGPSAAACR